MILSVDTTIYSDAAIAKTVYALSERYTFLRTRQGDREMIEVLHGDENLTSEFFNLLNDYQLREIIAEQTKDIRTLLYAKAFMNSDEEE